MTLSKLAMGAAIAIVTLFGAASASLAVEAIAKSAVNVREGPSVERHKVDSLFAGERVDVVECASNGWCRINHDGPDGWVSSSYLTKAGNGGPGGSYGRNDSDVRFGFGFDSSGNFRFGIGVGEPTGNNRPNHFNPPSHRAEVCFYDRTNLNGRQFCANRGERDNLGHSGWDNRISSIEVSGNARVTVCSGADLNGFCQTYDRDRPLLGFSLNNKISSYRVY